MYERLVNAIEQDNIQEVKNILTWFTRNNRQDLFKQWYSHLYSAVAAIFPPNDITKSIVSYYKAHKNVQPAQESYDTSFQFVEAAKKGDLAAFEALLDQSVNIHLCNDFAFRLAAENGRLNIIRRLLTLTSEPAQRAAMIHAKSDYVCEVADIEVIEELLPFISGAQAKAQIWNAVSATDDRKRLYIMYKAAVCGQSGEEKVALKTLISQYISSEKHKNLQPKVRFIATMMARENLSFSQAESLIGIIPLSLLCKNWETSFKLPIDIVPKMLSFLVKPIDNTETIVEAFKYKTANDAPSNLLTTAYIMGIELVNYFVFLPLKWCISFFFDLNNSQAPATRLEGQELSATQPIIEGAEENRGR